MWIEREWEWGGDSGDRIDVAGAHALGLWGLT
jgi:hypothetical protein